MYQSTDKDIFQLPTLLELNKEREQLAGARKVTFYVDGDVFLRTKWAYNNLNFKFIQI